MQPRCRCSSEETTASYPPVNLAFFVNIRSLTSLFLVETRINEDEADRMDCTTASNHPGTLLSFRKDGGPMLEFLPLDTRHHLIIPEDLRGSLR